MIYADLHSDTLTQYDSLSDATHPNHFQALQAAGCRLMCFAAFLRMERGDLLSTALSYGRRLSGEVSAHPDVVLRVFSSADMKRADREGKVGALFTVEEGAAVSEIADLSALYGVGMRMMTLTWNYANRLGYPNATVEHFALEGAAAFARVDNRPLTDFGREVVAEMNRLGIIVDVSHLSDGGFWDVLSLSTMPVVASHSNARALCPVCRNLTDDQLRALAQQGGVAGLNLTPDFLCAEGMDVLTASVDHAEHVWRVAGEDVLAFGFDFDGMQPRPPLTDCSSVPLLYDALSRRIPPRVVDKMAWSNFLRVFAEVCG